MTVQVDVWLRGDDYASTQVIDQVTAEPRDWTDEHVRTVLEGMLRAMYRLRHPEAEEYAVRLRGISWIVNPFESGGVVIAIEIPMGAAVAGPFDIDQGALEAMIDRVLISRSTPQSDRIH